MMNLYFNDKKCVSQRQGEECIACRWQGFGSRGTAGAASEKRSGTALCQTQLVPVSFATDPLQDTAKLISQLGGISGKKILMKG